MRFRISNHALASFFLRAIPSYQIEDAIRHPALLVIQQNGNTRVEKTFDGKVLRVIYKQLSKKEVLLVTAHYLD